MKTRILFLCTHNSCRSQLAEALVNHDLGDRFEAHSAGTAPSQPHPLALQVLAEIGVEHKNARSKHLQEFQGQQFELAITLCDGAHQACPVFLGARKTVHIVFDDPAAARGSEEEILAVFRRVRDEIRSKIEGYIQDPDGDTDELDLKLNL